MCKLYSGIIFIFIMGDNNAFEDTYSGMLWCLGFALKTLSGEREKFW